ncbi:ASCH domain-containing protein [Octadecabacter sp. 1_MG-2023]|uniref:ASCH domain-containing protein n=1 Tax=unclassified Octadecabacter TaxID=196158 RepID=UPI001C097CC1|nr:MULTISPECIES: ASCH domain-containing protein [unclassified Octadecabacter]MBU2994211.1 ASCH domain-containing protein [Octadecabacter sp. B2R22]MDO6734500.1 ASCH domain-containing protein [Octadecabacter sp. 1_MG-2023]
MPEYEDLQETYPGAGTFKLGHDAESCTTQINLVRRGGKRALCAPLADFEDDPQSMPVEGRTDIIAHWNNTPALVVKTVKVQQVRYCDVNTNMAHSDLGRDDFIGWRKATKAAIKKDHKFDPEMMLVFEFFQLIEDLDGRQIEPRS